MIHYNLTIKGRVQGVGFRYSAKNMARALGIKGFVRNLGDGSVYIEAEGEEAVVQDFLNWCKQGPDRARVEYVSVIESSIQGFTDFETRF